MPLSLAEAFGAGGLKQTGGKTYAGPVLPSQSTSAFRATGQNYTPPKPQVLGVSTSNSGSNFSSSSPIPQSTPQPQNNQQPQYDALKAQEDAFNQQLEADYNNAISSLGNQESGLRSQADVATSQIGNEAAATRTELGAQQATQQQGINQSLSTAEAQGKSALQQARDVFKQTQQANNAQLSALGISSSSVAEALSERLGVDVARRIAGVTGNLNEIRQNASNELARINDYYAQRSTQIQQEVENQKAQIQQALLQGLNQINSARQSAASDKAAKRATLLSQVQSSIASLTQQQQQFDQSLKTWAAQKQAALQPIAQDPNYIPNLLAQTQQINQQFQATPGLNNFVATPQFDINAQGQVKGQINTQKKPEDELF